MAIALFVQKVTLVPATTRALGRGFHSIVLINYLLDGCQIARRCRSFEDLLDKVVGENRLISVAAQVVHFTAFDRKVIRFALEGYQGLSYLFIGRLVQEYDMHRLVIFGCVQILVRDGFDFPDRSHEKPDLVSRGFFKLTFDLLFQQDSILFFRFKNDISTLDMGLHVLQTKGLEHPLQVLHFDDRVSADVDCAQEGYILVHLFL